MKILPLVSRQQNASVLLVAVVFGALLGVLMGSFLYLTENQVRAVDRSQLWNTSLVAAEAGGEEGLAMINRFANTATSLDQWPDRANGNGWNDLGNNIYSKTKFVGTSSNYYTIYITNNASSPVIKAIGYAYSPTRQIYVPRAIMMKNSGGSYFLGGMLAKKGIQINGGATFDSYNSQDPTYSTAGQWDVLKRKAGGNIGTIESNVVSAITDSGNSRIYGQLATGPNSTINMGGNASVGSIAWVNAGNKGIQSGWSRNDLNVTIPDAPALPAVSYLNLPSAGNRTLSAFGGTIYYRATTAYQMNSQNYLLITNGTVVIDAQQGFTLNGQAAIIVAPGAKLIVYLGTQNTQLDGQGVVNNTGNATNCIIYGKNNCQQIEINGGSSFVGYVYAPYADITLNGNSDTSGAMVGNTFQINGNMGFHYDENLGGPQSGSSLYRMTGWQEVPP